jgi:copper chaperone NosL
MTRWALFPALLIGCACAVGPAAAVDPVMGEDACAHCRMTIVSRATAAQIVRPGDEPVFFDDLGCLRDYLLHQPPAADAVIYVADHRGGVWADARTARYTKTGTATPMASGLLAHADEASRDADTAAAGGTRISSREVLGPPDWSTP